MCLGKLSALEKAKGGLSKAEAGHSAINVVKSVWAPVVRLQAEQRRADGLIKLRD